jgi:outer membrane lipoprotein-sorting protein
VNQTSRTREISIASRRQVLGGLGLLVAARPSFAQPATLSPEDQQAVAQVVGYLEGLTTEQGRFVQTTARGGQSEGTLYLQRPGRARFDYDPPSGLVIASDGRDVAVVDHRLKTMHVYPLSATPLGLFLARDIRLDRGVSITRVDRGAGGLTIVAQDGRKVSRGRIALTFAESPLALTGWALTDARGGTVNVRLSGFVRAEPHDADFFKLSDPHKSRSDPEHTAD